MKHLLIFCLLLVSAQSFSQEKKDRHLPDGNDSYKDKKYADAESEYRISQSKFTGKAAASYNLGNSIYRQGHASEAKSVYLKAVENAKSKPQKHSAYHNLGNVYMKEKNYQNAVEAYKNALRNNPNDEETRYNFALAKKFLKENPPPKDDKKKDKDKDKKDDKEKDKEKKDKKEDEKDKKDDQGKPEDKKDKPGEKPENKDQQKPQPQPGGISKQRLESLLEAVNNEEKKIQGKINAKKVKGTPVQTEKDW